jgi:hypothetical protein
MLPLSMSQTVDLFSKLNLGRRGNGTVLIVDHTLVSQYGAILIIGPANAKTEPVKHMRAHEPQVAKRSSDRR